MSQAYNSMAYWEPPNSWDPWPPVKVLPRLQAKTLAWQGPMREHPIQVEGTHFTPWYPQGWRVTGNSHPWHQPWSILSMRTKGSLEVLTWLSSLSGKKEWGHSPCWSTVHWKMTNQPTFVKAHWKPDCCSLRGLFIKTTDSADHDLDLGTSQESTNQPIISGKPLASQKPCWLHRKASP